MNPNFLIGVLTGWIMFTQEGKKFGNGISEQCFKYIKNNFLNKMEDKK